MTAESVRRELSHGPIMPFKDLPAQRAEIPCGTGVYVIFHEQTLLYTGVSHQGPKTTKNIRSAQECCLEPVTI